MEFAENGNLVTHSLSKNGEFKRTLIEWKAYDGKMWEQVEANGFETVEEMGEQPHLFCRVYRRENTWLFDFELKEKHVITYRITNTPAAMEYLEKFAQKCLVVGQAAVRPFFERI